MRPFYISIGNLNLLTIFPEIDVHMNGHLAITYSYSMYKCDAFKLDVLLENIENQKTSNFLGVILFEPNNRQISYRPFGSSPLTLNETQQAIAAIQFYRSDPLRWLL